MASEKLYRNTLRSTVRSDKNLHRQFSVKCYLNRLLNSRDISVFKSDIAEAKFYPINLFVDRCHPRPILQSPAVLARRVG